MGSRRIYEEIAPRGRGGRGGGGLHSSPEENHLESYMTERYNIHLLHFLIWRGFMSFDCGCDCGFLPHYNLFFAARTYVDVNNSTKGRPRPPASINICRIEFQFVYRKVV